MLQITASLKPHVVIPPPPDNYQEHNASDHIGLLRHLANDPISIRIDLLEQRQPKTCKLLKERGGFRVAQLMPDELNLAAGTPALKRNQSLFFSLVEHPPTYARRS